MFNRSIVEKPIVRYVLAGGLSYVIELSFLLFLHGVFSLNVEASTAIAFWVGLTVSFLLQKTFAFKDYQKNLGAISKQLGAYATLVMVNYVFTLTLVSILPSRFVIISRTVALIVTTAWNYHFYNKYIFSKRTKKASSLSLSNIKKFPGSAKSFLISKRFVVFLLMSSVVIIYSSKYLFTGNRIIPGDFDYYVQQYEAFRITVLKFHQFPLWNPWLAGGVPLYANPQFGLVSIQSLYVLLFGSIYGLKIAYITYALLGFWGMQMLSRHVIGATKLRSALIAYIWVFCGFFMGHTIAHLTFTSFFLLPWLVYFLSTRRNKYSWLGLGVTESAIILSSVHYGFLMMSLAMTIYFALSISKLEANARSISFSVKMAREDIIYIAKSFLVILLLAGHQFYSTFRFVSHNERLIANFSEIPPTIGVVFSSLFLPIGTFLNYPKTTWGWGEYSMYLGLGATIALIVCMYNLVSCLIRRQRANFLLRKDIVVPLLLVGVVGFALSLGEFSKLSPFYLLHSLPGFTQTRVPSRWLVFVVFSLLVFISSWKKNQKLINVLLLMSVVELFLSFGPPRMNGQDQIALPAARFEASFTQHDNHLKHTDFDTMPQNSYYFMTRQNVGQIYADDSLINTLSSSPPLTTARCAENTTSSCDFVITKNATVIYWSPNKIIISRNQPGPIELNMNVEAGWRINDTYPFAKQVRLDPAIHFMLPAAQTTYTLEYSPKYSPSWFTWKLNRL